MIDVGQAPRKRVAHLYFFFFFSFSFFYFTEGKVIEVFLEIHFLLKLRKMHAPPQRDERVGGELAISICIAADNIQMHSAPFQRTRWRMLCNPAPSVCNWRLQRGQAVNESKPGSIPNAFHLAQMQSSHCLSSGLSTG